MRQSNSTITINAPTTIKDPTSTLIAECRHQIVKTGLCLLPGFIKNSAVSTMQAEAQTLAPQAHYTEHWRATPNGAKNTSVSTLSKSTRASMSCVGYDRIGQQSILRRLYESSAMTAFVNCVFDSATLYPTADPLVSCMLSVLKESDELGWHYDPNDGVVSLLIQESLTGGEFEYAFDIRAPNSDAEAVEQAVLNNTYAKTETTALAPGTLSLFNGYRTLHRVAPVCGDRARIIALFNYARTPNYQFSDAIQHNFFGRTTYQSQTV